MHYRTAAWAPDGIIPVRCSCPSGLWYGSRRKPGFGTKTARKEWGPRPFGTGAVTAVLVAFLSTSELSSDFRVATHRNLETQWEGRVRNTNAPLIGPPDLVVSNLPPPRPRLVDS
ncbi:hypothetical protein LX36DRAFT_7432 [Colletotrichum falcatum]|nr:hypothetical protein LX36DRAFT_7432 [Colletotrichum falcatum]